MSLVTLLAAVTIAAAEPAPAPAPEASVPKDAARVLRDVSAAAKKRNLAALRKLMVSDFMYSPGTDADADRAIDFWKREKRFLPELVKVLGNGCASKDATHVACQGEGNLAFRAGFRRTDQGWRMEYFVEGE
jgi:hypothetical protein